MNYINRILEKHIIETAKEYACILITGPRQVGKSTLIKHLYDNNQINFITLDDISNRQLAKNDPKMFLTINKPPIFIDEIQYAPELFSYIKIEIDNGASPGSYIISGSQSFKLMNLDKESLAGRIAIINMSTLSQSEIYNYDSHPFQININKLIDTNHSSLDINKIYERIFNGSMPALVSGKYSNRNLYYGSYVSTFIEKDISEEIKSIDKFLFSDFIRACACRVSQVLNIHSIAADIGMSDDTAKRWLYVLEKSQIIYFIHPYTNNLLKRTIKTPKMYFFDTGLVIYLTKHSSPEVLINDSMSGAILENYVINEIIKSYRNELEEPLVYYYRDTNGNEIDLCIIYDNEIHPIEIKKTSNPNVKMVKAFKLLNNLNIKKSTGAIICFADNISAIDKDTLILPVHMI